MDCMKQEKLKNSFMNLTVHILKCVIDGKEEIYMKWKDIKYVNLS